MRTIKAIHTAEYAPIADLTTYTPLPSRSLTMLDPFLLLNHHGPQRYAPNNNGLPFGPHPHRGMETVTFIVAGDIMHKDSAGHESVITSGGVQWMTAGRGLIHAEVSSDDFKRNGGELEILQLWLNLPARLKMTEPFYKGLQKEDIPSVSITDGAVVMHIISGAWGETEAAFQSQTDVHLRMLEFRPGGTISFDIPTTRSILLYGIHGDVLVNDRQVRERQLVEFAGDAEEVILAAKSDALVLFGHAEPLNEPVVAQGPFVMNTRQEIAEAYDDYRQGKFGTWEH